tara:strand:+ start:809 stop:1192 length:384 start_codon:yes stop_codon:yes gene_type:complete
MKDKPYHFNRRAQNLIANLRGIPENYDHVIQKRELPIDTIMDRILNRYKIGVESVQDLITANWTTIVGAQNARHCSPSRIEREHTLIIAVSNPVIRQELQFNKSILLKNLHKIKGAHKIRTLIFKSG